MIMEGGLRTRDLERGAFSTYRHFSQPFHQLTFRIASYS